jgi:hypothetical protein
MFKSEISMTRHHNRAVEATVIDSIDCTRLVNNRKLDLGLYDS